MKRNVIILAGGLIGFMTIATVIARRPGRPPFVASYFFDESRFTAIRPGMSEDDVRDLLGPPLSRRSLSGREEHLWTYSSMPQPIPEWTEFEVRFDGRRRVLSTWHGTVHHDKDATTGQYSLIGPRPPCPPTRLATWPLQMIRGAPPRIGADGERVLVQVMASWCGSCTKTRPEIEAMLARCDGRPIKLVLVSVDEEEQALRDYLREHQEHPVAWDQQHLLPGFVRGKGVPQYALIQNGMICWFDFEHANHVDKLADLKWFIRYADFTKQVARTQKAPPQRK